MVQAKTLMIQGTASGVGKSMLVTLLCRLLSARGYTVAPFKGQNLTSLIEQVPGGYLARAQTIQARAAGVAPHPLMNPLALKPLPEGQVEVFLGGRCLGVMGWAEYQEQVFPRARERIKAALAELAARYEFIVIEGAGSPVEINLRETDLANLYVARLADPSVFLVADIDRGGAFAALVGTLALMEEDERRRVRGLIINKFHGEKELLRPGLDILEEKTGLPVTGILPYLPDLPFAGESRCPETCKQKDISPNELRRRLDGYLPLMERHFKVDHFITK